MTKYNEQQVIAFLLSLTFESLTHFVYGRGGLVATHFGCTPKTAAKWISRAEKTGLIEATDFGFVSVDIKEKSAKDAQRDFIDSEVSAGRVVLFSRAKHARNLAELNG